MNKWLTILVVGVVFALAIACQSSYEVDTSIITLKDIDIHSSYDEVMFNYNGVASVYAHYDPAIEDKILNMKIGKVYKIVADGNKITDIIEQE
jgi:hypothetical protein